ncbi:MAG: type I restriction enzyme S subunit [Akkermansiaceae bacterium]|jgi:type I restriction enzyme S subunit
MSELPKSWVNCTLFDVGDIVSGGTPSTRKPEFWGDDVPWISPSDLTGYTSKFIQQGAKSLTLLGLKKSSAKLIPKGSVHFSSRAPIGYLAISAQSLCTNQGFKSLIPAPGVFNEYVYFYLKSIRGLANSVATGTTFKELSGKAFAKLPFSLPPLAEQKRIVLKIEELFSELDAGEESLRRARRQLGVYRQSLLKQAFEGKLTAPWRAQHPDLLESPDQLLARIQAKREARHHQQLTDWQQAVELWEQNGNVGKKTAKPKPPRSAITVVEEASANVKTPEQWIFLKVEDLFHKGLSNGRSVKDREGGYKVLRLTALRDGRIDLREYKEGDWSDEEGARHRIHQGDFLISRGNGSIRLVGRGGVVPKDVEIAFPDTMIRLPLEIGVVDPDWFSSLWNSENFRQQIEKSAKTTAGIYKINQASVCDFVAPLCSLTEQQEIVRLLDEQFEVIEQNEREIDAALKRSEALRQSILKKAFTGHLVPQDPTDEPASELLARIQQERSERESAAKAAKLKKKAAKKVTRKRAKKL